MERTIGSTALSGKSCEKEELLRERPAPMRGISNSPERALFTEVFTFRASNETPWT